MLNYKIIIEMNDGRIFSHNCDDRYYALKLYREWEENKDTKGGLLHNNWTQRTVCSFEK